MISECFPNADSFTRQQLEKANRFALDHRVPLYGHIDVTYRCNLRCIHCYAGCERQDVAEITEESTASTIVEILTEAADLGCLRLLISGGEPLCRPDFEEIYRSAKELGLLVTVFTNGTLVTDRLIKMFREFPPFFVEVSIYGATPETYEGVTGVPGSYEACMAGVERLRTGEVRMGLKTVMLQRNIHELAAIEGLAKRLDLFFRIDPVIRPKLNGDKDTIEQRIDPNAAVAVEFADDWRAEQMIRSYNTGRSSKRQTPYQCDVGVTKFHVDPEGMVRPCIMERKIAHSAVEMGFKEAWRSTCDDIAQLADVFSPDSPCEECSDKPLCVYCPGMFYLENGSYSRPPSYICEIAALRKEKILSISH